MDRVVPRRYTWATAVGAPQSASALSRPFAILLALLSVALIVCYNAAPLEYSDAAMRLLVTIHWMFAAAYVLIRRAICRPLNYVGADMFFLAGHLVYVVGGPTGVSLGWIPFDYAFFPALNYNTRTLIFSLVVLLAFLAGYNWVKDTTASRLRTPATSQLRYDSALVLGNVLLLLACLTKLVVLTQIGIGVLFGEGYHLRHFEGSVLTVLGNVAFMSGVIIIAVSSALGHRRLVCGLLSKILIIGYVVVLGFFGARGHFIVLVGLLAVYNELIRRIRTGILMGCALVVLAAFVAIPVLRTIPGRSLREFRAVAGERMPFYGIGRLLVEGIGPYKTLNYTLGSVPQYFDYRKGKDYFYPLVTVLPWTKKVVYRAVGHVAPAKWATFNIHEPTFRAGGGFGYTMAGEFYLNFGVYGAYIAALILGVAMQKLRVVALTRGTPLWLVFYFLMLTLMILWVRGSFDNVSRPLVWGMVLCWAALGLGRAEGSISVPRRAGNAAAVKRPIR